MKVAYRAPRPIEEVEPGDFEEDDNPGVEITAKPAPSMQLGPRVLKPGEGLHEYLRCELVISLSAALEAAERACRALREIAPSQMLSEMAALIDKAHERAELERLQAHNGNAR